MEQNLEAVNKDLRINTKHTFEQTLNKHKLNTKQTQTKQTLNIHLKANI